MDRRRAGRLMHVGRRRVGMDHQARCPCIAGFSEIDHVASPVRASLGPEPRLGMVGRFHPVARTAALRRAKPWTAASPSPSRSKCRSHTRRSVSTTGRVAASVAFVVASASSRRKPSVPTWTTKASRLGPTSGRRISSTRRHNVHAIRRRQRAQPIRRRHSDVIESGPQRLAHKLQAVEGADGGQNVRAVGTLAPTGLEQPIRTGGVQTPASKRLTASLSNSLPRNSQTRCGQSPDRPDRAPAGIPVYPGANGIRGLPVAQPFAELQERDQRKPPRRIGRLAAFGIKVGKVGIGEQGAEPVAQDQTGIARPNAARAIRAVSSGTGGIGCCGQSDWPHSRLKSRSTPPSSIGSRIRHQCRVVCCSQKGAAFACARSLATPSYSGSFSNSMVAASLSKISN